MSLYGRNNRHHAPHDFTVGEEVTLHRFPDKRYPGVVDKITPTRVTVKATYPRGNTVAKTFWGATGVEIGGFHSSPCLRKRQDADFSEPVQTCAGCGITVFASSDNKTGLCTGCQRKA
jgi:hypothetical protein